MATVRDATATSPQPSRQVYFFFLPTAFSTALTAWDAASVLSRFAPRFCLRDWPDFFDMAWRGDLSLMVVLGWRAWMAPSADTTPVRTGRQSVRPPGTVSLAGTMLDRFKGFWQGVVLMPVVRLLLRWGVSPDTVTLVGTIGVAAGALVFFPRGMLLTGVLVITAFVFSDLVDGQMARLSGRTSAFGAFWDSTLDRIGDGAIFGGLVLYFAGPGDSYVYLCLSLYCVVMGAVTSYARARAESLGMDARGGLAERADRLVLVLVATGLGAIFGVPVLMHAALWILAVASTATVVFRIRKVHRQAVPTNRG